MVSLTNLIYSLKYQYKSSDIIFNPIGNVQAYVTDDYTVVEVSFFKFGNKKTFIYTLLNFKHLWENHVI